MKFLPFVRKIEKTEIDPNKKVPKFNLLSLSTTRTLASTTPAFKAYEHLPQQQGHMPPGSMGFGGKAQGKAPNWDKRRKGWVCVRVMSQAGTGSSMTVVRHERDPKVSFFHTLLSTGNAHHITELSGLLN